MLQVNYVFTNEEAIIKCKTPTTEVVHLHLIWLWVHNVKVKMSQVTFLMSEM